MVVLVLERVTASLRGELTRWLLEPRAGVFVGRVSGLVRDRLWDRVCAGARDGSAVLIHSANVEQGFAIRVHGDPRRAIRDFDGLALVQIPE